MILKGDAKLSERIFLYDFHEQANMRFISFSDQHRRFDLAIIVTNQFFGKLLVLDLQGNNYAIIGHDDLEEEGYLEYVFQLSNREGEELRSFLQEII